MEVIKGLNNIKPVFKHPVVTIGTFDAVHLGHQKIIRYAVKEARRIKGDSIVFTFEKRPLAVLTPDKGHDMLMSLSDKIAKIKKMGIRAVIVVNFDRQLARITADNFIEDILYKKLRPREIVIGNQFRFGRNRKGDVEVLRARAPKYGYTVKVIKEKKYKNIVVSSTKIRQLIKSGSLTLASRFLGYPYSLSGKVVKGFERGKIIGFPTANVRYDGQILLPGGVYAVYVTVGKNRYQGICNIGVRPTFYPGPTGKNIIEVHIFNFKRNIYNKYVKITWVKKIRDEQCFATVSGLIERIGKDIKIARRILSGENVFTK
ncbi:MAG: bifunctional riboflavin kinase/FAD synthetase [bacterium]